MEWLYRLICDASQMESARATEQAVTTAGSSPDLRLRVELLVDESEAGLAFRPRLRAKTLVAIPAASRPAEIGRAFPNTVVSRAVAVGSGRTLRVPVRILGLSLGVIHVPVLLL